jgi:hypothetical protein
MSCQQVLAPIILLGRWTLEGLYKKQEQNRKIYEIFSAIDIEKIVVAKKSHVKNILNVKYSSKVQL